MLEGLCAIYVASIPTLKGTNMVEAVEVALVGAWYALAIVSMPLMFVWLRAVGLKQESHPCGRAKPCETREGLGW